MKIDELLSSSPDEYFTKNFPYWLNGIDLQGRPGEYIILFSFKY
jgi:hypothetical protein